MVRVEVRDMVRVGVGVRVVVRVRFGVGGRVRVTSCITSWCINDVSNNFVHIGRIGIRRNGAELFHWPIFHCQSSA